VNEQLQRQQRKVFEDGLLSELLNNETIKEIFRYNRYETVVITDKRIIVIGKKFPTPEKDGSPLPIPGASLLKKVKATVGGDEDPVTFVTARLFQGFRELYLEENPVDNQNVIDAVKDKAKDKLNLHSNKPHYSHKLVIGDLKEFGIEKEYLPDVWRTFKYMVA
jgi:hypothetical protein